MADEPYRGAAERGSKSPELDRLVREGRQRLLDESAERARAEEARSAPPPAVAERNVRVALGDYYRAPARVAAISLAAAGAVAAVGAFFDVSFAVATPLLGVGIALYAFAAPLATRARVRAEEAWLSSLPFRVDGYFEALGADPRARRRLSIALTWVDPAAAPSADEVKAVFAVADTDAAVESRRHRHTGDDADAASAPSAPLVVRSGPISDQTRVQMPSGWVHRNTRFVEYVHALVDRVLLPMHRSTPLARVSLTRD